MNKGEKKIFTVIISIVIAFVLSVTAVSVLEMPDLNADNSAIITIGEAKTLVLEYTEQSEADVVFTKQETDIERGVRKYDIEFNNGTTEYEYCIDAHTGKTISSMSQQID